jgi:hypothetical protein
VERLEGTLSLGKYLGRWKENRYIKINLRGIWCGGMI